MVSRAEQLIQDLEQVAKDLTDDRDRLLEAVRSVSTGFGVQLAEVDTPIAERAQTRVDEGCRRLTEAIDAGIEGLLARVKTHIQAVDEATR